jgi:alkylhydroperoxidase family enzyme
MLRSLISRGIDAQERYVGVPMAYARVILRTSIAALIKYALIMPMANHRQRLPPDELFTARLVATRREDCGTCVQIVVNLARKAGVPADLIQAVLAGAVATLPERVQDVYRFTEIVVEGNDDAAELRERIRRRHGDEGLVDLALAIAAARVFPTTKRVLGYAVSCSKVRIEV